MQERDCLRSVSHVFGSVTMTVRGCLPAIGFCMTGRYVTATRLFVHMITQRSPLFLFRFLKSWFGCASEKRGALF